MIKLFRQLRRNMIADGSAQKIGTKRWKYLQYAIGEIVLVVIGILIALGINNWNQKQIAIKKEKTALTNLILDLEEESEQLNQFIDGEREFYNAGLYLSEHYALDQGFKLNDTILSKLNILGARITFKPIKATFQELISTGNIALIRNEKLRKRLIQFFNEIDRTSEIGQNNNTNIVDGLYNPMLFDATVFIHRQGYNSGFANSVFGQIAEDQNRIFDSSSLESLIKTSQAILAKPEVSLKLFNRIQLRTQLAIVQLERYNQMKKEISELIDEIQLEI